MISPSVRVQRIYALLGAAMADDLPGLHALTEDLDRVDLAQLVEDFARVTASHLAWLAPAEWLDPIIRERAIRAALENSERGEE